uniref:Alpha-1,3-glucosyltransferase n=1 Tax=Strigamia maritima TaxID=126957 RepID=T1JIW9_STRMM
MATSLSNPVFWSIIGGITALKILLIPSKSTDFEVHRNWLAITHTFPFDKWYYEASISTSEWTLDYPPFFAWFECALSYIAQYFDSAMLSIHNHNYASQMTILFQRLSVIVTDLIFAYGVKECAGCLGPASWQSRRDVWVHNGFILSMMLFGNAGLLLVDHIHFQYNGFLFGFLLISIARMLQHKHLESAFWFCILLNLKHIYLYFAPAYFVYLLRSYCFLYSTRDGGVLWKSFSIKNFTKLSFTVISVFAASFGPFIAKGQLNQVLSRLFPFKRVQKTGLMSDNKVTASMTGGLVQEYQHSILPNITPTITLICSVVVILPALIKLWHRPSMPWDFVRCLTLCAYGTYMFGWHVHEKAILLIIIPLTLLAAVDWDDACIYMFTSLTGHFSLFPLFFTLAETSTKILLTVMHAMYSCFGLCLLNKDVVHEALLSTFEKIYLFGLVFVQLYHSYLHEFLGLSKKYEFLPLLLFSAYCAPGILYSWLKFYKFTLARDRKSCLSSTKNDYFGKSCLEILYNTEICNWSPIQSLNSGKVGLWFGSLCQHSVMILYLELTINIYFSYPRPE